MARFKPGGDFKRLINIRESLALLLNSVRQGEEHYLVDISKKLRLLFIKKDRVDPLIKKISDVFSLKISVYMFLSLQERIDRGLLSPAIANGLTSKTIDNPILWFNKGHELVEILDAIGKPDQIILGKNKYSLEDIIEVYEDKIGAHIDEHVDDSDLEPHDPDFSPGSTTIVNRIIYDTARNAVKLIDMIINCVKTGEGNIFVKRI